MLDRLKKDFMEEVNDFRKYLGMAEEAEQAHMDAGHQVLRDMAKEEFIHAKHIRGIMMDHGKWTDPACEELWKEAKAEYDAI